MQEFLRKLEELISAGKLEGKLIYRDEPMSKHTTFRIGGNADCYIQIDSIEMLKTTIELCNQCKVPFYVIGNGSNLLVGDKGYRGVIIDISNKMNHVTGEGEYIYAQGGALLSKIARKALEQGLAGMEFAAGIPGTLGGAMVMNAGAYGGEMKDITESVTIMDVNGTVQEILAEDLAFGYRTSLIKSREYIVLGAKLKLEAGEKEEIQNRMNELKVQRVTKQPLEYPSAGSTFKRPEGYFAAKLIDDTGLRGFQVGGAQVSEKHCGFVINAREATASDVIELMQQVSEKVKEKYGVTLEPEIKRIGEF